MKKFASLITIIVCITLAGCSQSNENSPRTRDVSGSITNKGETFYSQNLDLDFDGKNETVTMEVSSISENEWESTLNITMGNYNTSLPMLDGWIDAVYLCDMDTQDNVRDLAVITNEGSGDPRIRIIKYDKDLPLHKFRSIYDGGICDDFWLGYATSYFFNVNDDDSITMEMQTPSNGMWSVYRTFKKDSDGVFEEVSLERYDILPDFMETAYTKNLDDFEVEMWNKGYIKAYIDYTYQSFNIKAGEYVKPLYDDGNDKIYVEKEDGTGGWINIDFSLEYSMFDFNQNFFYLAG